MSQLSPGICEAAIAGVPASISFLCLPASIVPPTSPTDQFLDFISAWPFMGPMKYIAVSKLFL